MEPEVKTAQVIFNSTSTPTIGTLSHEGLFVEGQKIESVRSITFVKIIGEDNGIAKMTVHSRREDCWDMVN